MGYSPWCFRSMNVARLDCVQVCVVAVSYRLCVRLSNLRHLWCGIRVQRGLYVHIEWVRGVSSR